MGLGLIFFFFKQKTAYEMRISDWSSDVCSSDLGAVKGATDMLAEQMKTLASMVFQCEVEDIELADGFARMKENHEAALPFMALGAIPNANNEIGRASCRERVCEYV